MKRRLPIAIVALVALIQVGANGSVTETAKKPAPVSFRHDVAPLLAMSCSTRSCHGGSRPPSLDAHADPKAMRAALVGVGSEERPSHSYVRPGDPEGSYLVQKLDGRLDDRECADHDCGEAMPLDNPSLPPAARQTIRTWIAEGAKDN